MKIIKLEASNFKKLTAVQIEPDGNVVVLTGDNGAGKSSILDAIQVALAGGKTIPEQPIRVGQESGETAVTLDNGYKVIRRFTPKTNTLTIQNAEGRISSPQAMLDTFVGNLAFDPLAFSRLRAAEQWEQLRELVGLDFTKIDADRTKTYDDRTVINREILRLQTLLKEIPPSVDDAPEAETSTSEVLTEISKATQHNAEIDSQSALLNQMKQSVESAQGASREAKAEVEKWNLIAHDRERERIRLEGDYNAAIERFNRAIRADIYTLNCKLTSLEVTNAQTRLKADRNKMLAAVKSEQNKSEALTAELEQLDADKKQRIADAKFPLSELSFNGEVITYRGIPFSQVSDGEKLRVSVAVGMALNPKLRIIFVRDGSLLDKSGLQTIADLAKSNDYQVWLEDARSADPAAIMIEDGSIAK